jgi:hypothetical protein
MNDVALATPPARIAAILRKNRAFAVLVQCETRAHRLRNAGRAVPAELATRIQQAKTEYESTWRDVQTVMTTKLEIRIADEPKTQNTSDVHDGVFWRETCKN